MAQTYRILDVHEGVGVIVTPIQRFPQIICDRCREKFLVSEPVEVEEGRLVHMICDVDALRRVSEAAGRGK